ncbi:MAG: ferrochelatase [Kofleriaceae bacterium]
MPNGLLLINLGTPDEPTTPAVRRYLREFLGDPRVIDINPVGRAMLLNLVILPFRPAKSAHAYQQVWDPKRGSPLLYHSQDLAAGVAAKLGPSWRVELAMRYGSPSIPDGIAALERAEVDRIVVLPLFPQYASSSTGTAVARVMELAGERWNVPSIDVVPAFYADPGFLDAFTTVARPVLSELSPDHVLFSFHGLPVRQIVKTDPTGAHCFASPSCCDTLANKNCYRAQSFFTARAIAERLALPASSFTVCFQSRLGRTPWIQPYTDVVLDELAKAGTKRLAVMCPAFVADCLETIEEIGIRARAQFKAAGGDELVLVPSLNATQPWVDAVAAIATRHAAGSHGLGAG